MALTIITLVIIAPLTAQAGFFSYFLGLFKGSQEFISVRTELNSQNIPLLKAALNHDPNPSKGGGDIVIVGGSALLPDAGPS